MKKDGFWDSLNLRKRCAASGVGLWQCPHFLFMVMGAINILAILTANAVARRFAEPEIAALAVLLVSALLFIIGHAVTRSFENIVEASRLKSEFVSIISHELRSPLSAIKWSLDLARAEKSEQNLPKDVSTMLSVVGEENEKMIKLVNTLLEVRRVEDGKIELAPEVVSLKEITGKAIRGLDSFARASNIELIFRAEDGLSPVFADPKKIFLVVASLVDNALRYSPGGSRVGVSVSNRGDGVLWQASDHGSGIPKEERKKMFGKFFRSHNAFRYRSGGLGIALFLAKAFVEASGGKIGFDSKDKSGSVFWFFLPSTKRAKINK